MAPSLFAAPVGGAAGADAAHLEGPLGAQRGLRRAHHAALHAGQRGPPEGLQEGESLLTSYLRRIHRVYRLVQLNFTPEIEVFYILLDRSLHIVYSDISQKAFGILQFKSSSTSL